MASDDLDTLARLRTLLEVTRVVQTEEQVSQLLADMARTVSESLGFRTVVVNSYRPAFDDFEVTVVHGSEVARHALLGTTGIWAEWESLLDDRFCRHGVYVIPAGEFDWHGRPSAFTPDLEVSADPNAWHPDDALFVPLVHTEGHLLGIISVDEPVTGMRPGDEHLQVLWAVAEHAALALQSARESALADNAPAGARPPADGVVAADRDAGHRRGAAVDLRRHRRARLPAGQHRPARPRHQPARAAPRGRLADGRPGDRRCRSRSRQRCACSSQSSISPAATC